MDYSDEFEERLAKFRGNPIDFKNSILGKLEPDLGQGEKWSKIQKLFELEKYEEVLDHCDSLETDPKDVNVLKMKSRLKHMESLRDSHLNEEENYETDEDPSDYAYDIDEKGDES